MTYGRFTNMLRADVVAYLHLWGFATCDLESTNTLRKAAHLNELIH